MSQDQKNKYYEDAIEELKRHADTSNREVGLIQQDISVVKNDISWFKEKLVYFESKIEKFESRVWWILGTVVLMGIGQIIATIIGK